MRRDVHSRARLHAEHGMALLSVLLLLMIMSAATLSLSVGGQTQLAISRNHEVGAQAQAAAEAGLNHALDVTIDAIGQWQALGFNSPSDAMTFLLAGGGSLAIFGIPMPAGPLCGNPAPAYCLALTDPTTGTQVGAYMVRVFDEDDIDRGLLLSPQDLIDIGEAPADHAVGLNLPQEDANSSIIVQAWGFASDGLTLTRLEAVVGPVVGPAIVSGCGLTMGGNVTLGAGDNGSVHANCGLTVNGNPTITGTTTSSDGITGNLSFPDNSQPVEDVTPVAAIDYRPLANFILHDNGTMTTNPGGAVVCNDAVNPCEDNGYLWEYQGPGPGPGSGWELREIDVLGNNNTYYVEGHVEIRRNEIWNVTIIAEGNIDITGNGDITANTPGLLFVTDMDLDITGGHNFGNDSLMLVHEQLSWNGTANTAFDGQLVIEDAAALSNLVTTNRVSGNVTITNNGGLLIASYDVKGWREW